MEEKICPKCGYKNPPEARFCLKCGYRFPEAEESISFKPSLNTYLFISGILSIVYFLDMILNDVYRPLYLSLLIFSYPFSLAGIIIILYLFLIKRSIDDDLSRRLLVYGNLLAGIGSIPVFLAPIIVKGYIMVSLYWILFIIISYKASKIKF